MQQHELNEFVLNAFAELATLHAAAAATAERAWEALAKSGNADLRAICCGDDRGQQGTNGRPKINPATFAVEWRGLECDLGPSILFKLIQQLARRPGRYFTYDILMEDIWKQRCSNTTVRSAVKRLRRALRDAGMPELAAAIRGHGECYGLFLDGNDS
ncbi:MAG: winged helix-turn-helix transcriptional regulator [Phycisphaerae bacterium]|nr:winged helix-turn-helix transcriptional regulator [Phycisphaerae bacterium]